MHVIVPANECDERKLDPDRQNKQLCHTNVSNPRSTLALALVETVAPCEWRPRSLFPVIWRIVFDVQTLRSFFFTSDARQRN